MYDGEFNTTTGQRDGRGKLIYSNGSIYEGYWKDGKKQGRGRMIYGDGTVYEGEWADDKCEGYAQIFHQGNSKY
jgi:hypothetical protein